MPSRQKMFTGNSAQNRGPVEGLSDRSKPEVIQLARFVLGNRSGSARKSTWTISRSFRAISLEMTSKHAEPSAFNSQKVLVLSSDVINHDGGLLGSQAYELRIGTAIT